VTLSLQSILYPLPALCVALIIHTLSSWLLNRPPAYARALQDFALDPSANQAAEVPLGSPTYKLRLAFSSFGLEVSGRERFYHYLAMAVLALALAGVAALLALPPLFWLGCPLVSYFVVNHQVNGRWDKFCREMEKELPSYLMNLSSVIQLNPNPVQALEDAALSLDPQGSLRPWIARLARKLQAHGRQALEDMQPEAQAISAALLLVLVEIGRLWETGGPGFAGSFQLVSENLSGIQEGRMKAFARAAGAWSTIRLIILALGAAILMAFSSPGSRSLFHTPLVQLALLAAVAWAAFGFSYISDLIRETVA
jgi:Flp pilus assembly protein TadB